MDLRYKGQKDITDSVSLLISILVRYPEVATIDLEADHQVLKFTFLFNQSISTDNLTNLKGILLESIQVYNYLENRKPTRISINQQDCDEITVVEILRDVESLSQEEIALIVDVFNQYFRYNLVKEASDDMIEEDLLVQEELIEHMLESVKGNNDNDHLYAFREEGKVLVFNK